MRPVSVDMHPRHVHQPGDPTRWQKETEEARQKERKKDTKERAKERNKRDKKTRRKKKEEEERRKGRKKAKEKAGQEEAKGEVVNWSWLQAQRSEVGGEPDGAGGGPGEEANGPGARVCRVHHILVELQEGCLKQPYEAPHQPLSQDRHQPADQHACTALSTAFANGCLPQQM